MRPAEAVDRLGRACHLQPNAPKVGKQMTIE
jgi:hypothetical protein